MSTRRNTDTLFPPSPNRMCVSMADRKTRDTDAKVFTIDRPDGVVRVEVEASAPDHDDATDDVEAVEAAVRGAL